MRRSLLCSLLLLLAASVGALVAPARLPVSCGCRSPRASTPTMGNNAPDGPFTPVCLAGKVVLGEKTFNKYRGKIISFHSQFIKEFCEDYGVPRKMGGALIAKAKTTGGILGFLS